MGSRKITYELFSLLHKAGWLIGDTAFSDAGSVCWLIYGTHGGYEIRAEDGDRGEAWKQACRQDEALGLIEPGGFSGGLGRCMDGNNRDATPSRSSAPSASTRL
jgi:hypothetical protein